MKVFVLEDDAALRFALVQIIEDCEHTAYAAHDISAASEILAQVAPDLLLLDLMIGSVESIQIADLAGYRVPDADVIFLTGSNKYPNGELFELSKNAAWVLRKPISFGELKAMLSHFEKTSSRSSPSRPTETVEALSSSGQLVS